MRNDKLLAYIAFGIVCLVWGTTYLAIRVAVETIPPLLLTGIRYLAAGLILLAILKLRGEKLPRDRRVLRELALIGALMVGGGNLSVVWAEQYVPSGMAALLVATATAATPSGRTARRSDSAAASACSSASSAWPCS